MSRILRSATLLVAALAFAVTGCADGALTDGVAPDASPTAAVASAAGAVCPSSLVSVSGPSPVTPGQTATYTAGMKPGCSFTVISWTVTGATKVSQNGNSVVVQAPSSPGSFTVRANVVYELDNLSSGTKTVTVAYPPLPDLNLQAQNSGPGVSISWQNTPPNAAICTLTRFVKNLSTGQSTSTSWNVGSSPVQDNAWTILSGGGYYLSYRLVIKDSAGNVLNEDSTPQYRADTSY